MDKTKKNKYQWLKKMMTVGMLTIVLTNCSQYKFQVSKVNPTSAGDNNTLTNPPENVESPTTPVTPGNGTQTPAPINKPVPEKEFKYTQGSCSINGITVLSCLKCVVPAKKQQPMLSEKAQALFKIMNQACQVKNKSDPQDKSIISDSDRMSYLNRADELNYPTTEVTKSQEKLIQDLSVENSNLVKKLFGGLWYQPPYSDDFETYFGIDIKEAKSLFCFGVEKETSFGLDQISPLLSRKYIECQSRSRNCQELPAYNLANSYRLMLQSSIIKSLENPFNDDQLVPLKKCKWEKIEGTYNSLMETKLLSWLDSGYSVSAEFTNQNPRCESIKLNGNTFDSIKKNFVGEVKFATYSCQDFDSDF